MMEQINSRTNASRLAQFLRQKKETLAGSLFVAIDGRSGSGKSTIAAFVADELNSRCEASPCVTVIEGDQFYAGGSSAAWDKRTAIEKANQVIDWRRQHALLTALRTRGSAEWRAFDWESEDWDAAIVPLRHQPYHCVITDIVILEGAYSARPELADLIDVRVLLQLSHAERRRRLRQREGEDYQTEWEARWSEAEDYYFGTVLDGTLFDLVLE